MNDLEIDDEGTEMILLDLQLGRKHPLSAELIDNYNEIPKWKRKKIMDMLLTTYAKFDPAEKGYVRIHPMTDEICEEMDRIQFSCKDCVPIIRYLGYKVSDYPCLCFEIYSTLRANPNYLNGMGLKGFCSMLTSQRYERAPGLNVVFCIFSQRMLSEIGIHRSLIRLKDGRLKDVYEPIK